MLSLILLPFFWPIWPTDDFTSARNDESRCGQGWFQAPSPSLTNIERRGPKPLQSWWSTPERCIFRVRAKYAQMSKNAPRLGSTPTSVNSDRAADGTMAPTRELASHPDVPPIYSRLLDSMI